jgi:Flp pilus assembly protein TadG
MRPLRVLRTTLRDERGATIVEFAMVLPVLCLLLLGLLELGYRSYAASVLQGALHEAARLATVGNVSMNQIDARVRNRLASFARRSIVTTRTTSYYDFAGVRRSEKVVGDTVPLNAYNPGDCFEDSNGNNTYDVDRGRQGTGGADDIVRYQVTISYPRLLPVGGFLGWSARQEITANTVLRNQPYAGRAIQVVRIRIAANGTVTSCT